MRCGLEYVEPTTSLSRTAQPGDSWWSKIAQGHPMRSSTREDGLRLDRS